MSVKISQLQKVNEILNKVESSKLTMSLFRKVSKVKKSVISELTDAIEIYKKLLSEYKVETNQEGVLNIQDVSLLEEFNNKSLELNNSDVSIDVIMSDEEFTEIISSISVTLDEYLLLEDLFLGQ